MTGAAIQQGLAARTRSEKIDGKSRGMPPRVPETALDAVSEFGWSLADEDLCLPALTVSLPAFEHNINLFSRYASEHGVRLCWHGKTMMAPQLLSRLLTLPCSVGLCAATVPQATVMAETGAKTVFIANQVAGRANIRRLAELIKLHHAARFLSCIDSEAGLRQLVEHGGSELGAAARFEVLIEVGVANGRAGVRSLEQALHLLDTIDGLRAAGAPIALAGVSTYEGAVPGEGRAWDEGVAELFTLTREIYACAVSRIDQSHPPIVSAGGSATFDLAVIALGNGSWPGERAPELWLRPGVAPVYDDVVYRHRLAQIDKRGGFDLDGKPQSAAECFMPALALWTVVQSIPDGDMAILAAGIRDFPIDAGYPTLLAHYRNGGMLAHFAAGSFSIGKANDQHSYMPLAGLPDIRIGDVLKFGISHPCTTFDRWPMLFLVNSDDVVLEVIKTYF